MMPGQNMQAMAAAMKARYVPAKKSKAQRLSRDSVMAQRFSRYGSDVERSVQKRGAKRKGFLSRLASEGYRA